MTERLSNSTQRPAAAEKPNLVVVAGPTAVGKTRLSIELALRFCGEVVNADSRYLYRGMDIGVAKPTLTERRGVPHHLIDVCDPTDDMSLATFQSLAMAAISNVQARGRLPILVGGTPLYVNAVVEGWTIPRVPPQPGIRARLEAELTTGGIERLAAKLWEVDPVTAERSGKNGRRIIRALEIYEVTGVPMSIQEGKGPPPFNALELGLTMPREQLHRAVDTRVDAQIADGLADEVRVLLAGGLSAEASAMSALGYRQLLPFLAGEQSLAEAVARIKADTHRYIRHQETWLRRNTRLVAIDVTHPTWVELAARLVQEFLSQTGPTHGSGRQETESG